MFCHLRRDVTKDGDAMGLSQAGIRTRKCAPRTLSNAAKLLRHMHNCGPGRRASVGYHVHHTQRALRMTLRRSCIVMARPIPAIVTTVSGATDAPDSHRGEVRSRCHNRQGHRGWHRLHGALLRHFFNYLLDMNRSCLPIRLSIYRLPCRYFRPLFLRQAAKLVPLSLISFLSGAKPGRYSNRYRL